LNINGEAIVISALLILSAVSSFLSITLWSRLKVTQWGFFALCCLVWYIENLYAVLSLLGLVPGLEGFISAIVYSAPPLLFIAGCLAALFPKAGNGSRGFLQNS
jgi:hypothetical protein